MRSPILRKFAGIANQIMNRKHPASPALGARAETGFSDKIVL
jgi:hypothetical protein